MVSIIVSFKKTKLKIKIRLSKEKQNTILYGDLGGRGEREENNEALERSRLILITLEPVDDFDFSHKEIADWLRKRQLTFRGLPNFVNLGT